MSQKMFNSVEKINLLINNYLITHTNMKLAIMQPYFLPYLGYFQLIKAVDKYLIYDDVNFIKRGWINRNNMLINGQRFLFTLPLCGASQNKLINEIYLSNDRSTLLKTIYNSYKKAPYFSTIFSMVEQILGYEDKNLANFVGNSIIQISNYLQLDTEFLYSSDIKEKNNLLKGQEKVLNICAAMGASEYINSIGGADLYSKEQFEECNIKLSFIKTQLIEYKQFNNQFVPDLSILDVLMFNSVEQTNELLNKYEFV